MRDLVDRTVVITGGGSGIGRAMARAFRRAGSRIVVADIERPPADKVVDELRAGGGEAHAVTVDVSDRASVAALADRAEQLFGPVHVICNNAGVTAGGPLPDVSLSDWDWVLGVNLMGVVYGVQTFVPRMLAHGEGGHVVNTVSIAGIGPRPGTGIYTTAKFGVLGLSEMLRADLEGRGVSVTALCPGLARTNISDGQRNRPAALGGPEAEPDSERRRGERAAVEAGIDPELVGERVVRAVRDDEMWAFTHPDLRERITTRFDAILAGFDHSTMVMEEVRAALEES